MLCPINQATADEVEYSRLSLVYEVPKKFALYRWASPGFTPGNFQSMIVDPIILYQKPDGMFTNPVSTRNQVDASLGYELKKRFVVADQAGPSTLRLSVAITGAMIPKGQHAPTNLAQLSTLLNHDVDFTGSARWVLAIEVKVKESLSGQILSTVFYEIDPVYAKQYMNNPSQIEQSLSQWTITAVQAIYTASVSPTNIGSKSIDLDEAKSKCSDLGFKKGSEPFGNCVLKLTK